MGVQKKRRKTLIRFVRGSGGGACHLRLDHLGNALRGKKLTGNAAGDGDITGRQAQEKWRQGVQRMEGCGERVTRARWDGVREGRQTDLEIVYHNQ